MTDPREEAERLIASVLGSASVAAENLQGFATGSPECCVCPVCKAIAAAREPNPNVAERLATGAGDLASGVASFLRTMARAAGDFTAPGGGSTSAPRTSGTTATEDPWATATRAAAEAEAAGAAAGAGSTASGSTASGSTAAGSAGSASTGKAQPATAAPGAAGPAATPDPPKPMAKKAVKPKAPAQPPATEPGEER